MQCSAATDNVRCYVAAVPVDELSPQGLANLRGVMSQAQIDVGTFSYHAKGCRSARQRPCMISESSLHWRHVV